MAVLPRIPLVDLRGYTPLELLFLYRQRARTLATEALSLLGPARFLTGMADRTSRRWLEKCANPYLAEIGLIAEALGIPGTYVLNTCVEWGCTSAALASEGGPVLHRVLDWPFPRIGELCVVAQFRGRLGDFYNVTWPGYSGSLQAMAPGRFAAAVNQAPMRNSGGGRAGNWLAGRIRTGKNAGLPPTHLLRQVLETARDYHSARTMLCTTPLAVPVIYILTGTRPGEGCVIDRTEDGYGLRELRGARVCATNQFESELNNGLGGWQARPIDNAGRYAKAQTMTPDLQGFSWFTPPIANLHSRLVMTANAASGLLMVLGTEGVAPATEIFRLSP